MTDVSDLLKVLGGTAGVDGTRTLYAARQLCLGPPDAKHVSGGAQLAAVVAMLEAQTERPLIQAAIQFRSSPSEGSAFEVAATWLNRGRSITQAEAQLSADDKVLAVVQATLGARDDIGSFDWAMPPDVPAPQDCSPLPFIRMEEDDLHAHLHFRIANNPDADRDGRLIFWVPWTADMPVSSAFLALVADYLPEAIHFNIGRPAGAVSLDNSLRIVRCTQTRWVLCETRLHAVEAGLFHGSMSIFDDQKRLLAIASQSGVVRPIWS
jgi:acyl-CoA thioesterase II